MQLPIVVSAILPLVIIPESDGWVGVVVGVVTWLVDLGTAGMLACTDLKHT